MKHLRTLVMALLLVLVLSACAASAGGGAPDAGGTPMEKNPGNVDITAPDAPAPVANGTKEGGPEAPDHIHHLSEEDNTVDHDPVYYCGNNVTTVSWETGMDGESRKVSFWYDDSVALTDLLLYLDYSGEVCTCLPEYSVDTEFGAGYGVSLTGCFARHDGGQVSLTAEQVEEIRAILDRQGAN